MNVESSKPAGLAWTVLDLRSPLLGLLALVVISGFLALQLAGNSTAKPQTRRIVSSPPREIPWSREWSGQDISQLFLVDSEEAEIFLEAHMAEANEIRAQWGQAPSLEMVVNVAGLSEHQVLRMVSLVNAQRLADGLPELVVQDLRNPD